MVREECFAFKSSCGSPYCIALTDLCCKKQNCHFYKHYRDVDMVKIEKQIKEYAKWHREEYIEND